MKAIPTATDRGGLRPFEGIRVLDLTHVVDPFVRPSLTTGLTYWRLHGIGNHYHQYTDAELRTLAAQVPAEGDTYVMFNNIPRVRDAERFAKVL